MPNGIKTSAEVLEAMLLNAEAYGRAGEGTMWLPASLFRVLSNEDWQTFHKQFPYIKVYPNS